MNCANCYKELTDEIISFCEICEEYYCMDCSKEHKKHRLTFARITGDNLIKINTGVSAAGIGEIHHKFFTDYDWVSRTRKCGHVESLLEEEYPVFYCEDGKVRCFNCFYNSEFKSSDPLMKIDDEKLMWLLHWTYEPYNIDFDFDCDNQGVRGEEINLSLTIKNHKVYPIEDINICVEAFAADPLPANIPFLEYSGDLSQNHIIFKEFHFDKVEANDILRVEFKVKVPFDGEIKKGQFCNFSINGESEDKYCDKGFLKIPDDLMIYASFNYNSYSGFKFFSDIEVNIVKLK